MKTSLIQAYINKIINYERQIKNLEKLIELNMNDLHEIADQRDWYYEEYQKMKAGNEELKKIIEQKWYKE